MERDSHRTNVTMIVIFMGLVFALAALLFLMIGFG
jgi:hypothetical protein